MVLVRSFIALVLATQVAGCAVAASPSPPPGTPGAGPGERTMSEAENGASIDVSVGSLVTVVLQSTYWQIQPSSDAAVLELVAGPSVAPAGPTACVPGGGCGTVSAIFDALAPGTAQIRASRTSCGEALACASGEGTYQVTITVHG